MDNKSMQPRSYNLSRFVPKSTPESVPLFIYESLFTETFEDILILVYIYIVHESKKGFFLISHSVCTHMHVHTNTTTQASVDH